MSTRKLVGAIYRQSDVALRALLVLILSFLFSPAWSQGVGPDVSGVRVGMTHAEALAALRARAPNENWTTRSISLQFQNTKQEWQTAPNGAYRAALMTKEQSQNPMKLEKYTVIFSPTPGNERVVGVVRSQVFAKGNPLQKDLIAQLSEKYGRPGDSLHDSQFTWAFDQQGRARPLTQDQSGAPCRHVRQVGEQPHEADPWSFEYKPHGTIDRKPIAHSTACGAFMVRARIVATPQGFVQGYAVELIGHDLATSARSEAEKMVAVAKADDLSNERNTASRSPKPTF